MKTYAESEAGWMAVSKGSVLSCVFSYLSAQTPYIPAGSTALSLVIMQNSLAVAWCGDSRAVICQGTKATRLTRDHKPKLPDEEKRIKDLGGIVDISDEGVYRVMGVLAVSRAIGDIDLKVQSDQCVFVVRMF
jgi:serine/threonine protein phosphatase PrpC